MSEQIYNSPIPYYSEALPVILGRSIEHAMENWVLTLKQIQWNWLNLLFSRIHFECALTQHHVKFFDSLRIIVGDVACVHEKPIQAGPLRTMSCTIFSSYKHCYCAIMVTALSLPPTLSLCNESFLLMFCMNRPPAFIVSASVASALVSQRC